MSTLGVLGSTLRVLMRLIWTRTRLGMLGVPRVMLGVAGPDANPNLWLVHYKRNAKALSSATISESETLIESPPSFLANMLCSKHQSAISRW